MNNEGGIQRPDRPKFCQIDKVASKLLYFTLLFNHGSLIVKEDETRKKYFLLYCTYVWITCTGIMIHQNELFMETLSCLIWLIYSHTQQGSGNLWPSQTATRVSRVTSSMLLRHIWTVIWILFDMTERRNHLDVDYIIVC